MHGSHLQFFLAIENMKGEVKYRVKNIENSRVSKWWDELRWMKARPLLQSIDADQQTEMFRKHVIVRGSVNVMPPIFFSFTFQENSNTITQLENHNIDD